MAPVYCISSRLSWSFEGTGFRATDKDAYIDLELNFGSRIYLGLLKIWVLGLLIKILKMLTLI